MTAPLAPMQGLVGYLAVLAGPPDERKGYLELRHRRAGGTVRQRFLDASTPNAAGVAARALSRSGDVFVGCAPRARRSGGKAAIERAWVLWVDCDTVEAVDRLAGFEPQPTMLVRSGRGLHAYWAISEPLAPQAVERANRRLAHALSADRACAEAARVLRPPLTLNHKYEPPEPVLLRRFTGERLLAQAVVGTLQDPPPRRPTPRAGPRRDESDPLLSIDPAVYVAALTGQAVGRDGKVRCPFHEDRTPSLHVYPDTVRGWYCFGRCGRGGSIYDLAAPLLGYDTNGADFVRLAAELRRRLGLDDDP